MITPTGSSQSTAVWATQAGRTAELRRREFEFSLGPLLVTRDYSVLLFDSWQRTLCIAVLIRGRAFGVDIWTYGSTTVATNKTPRQGRAGTGSKGQGRG